MTVGGGGLLFLFFLFLGKLLKTFQALVSFIITAGAVIILITCLFMVLLNVEME